MENTDGISVAPVVLVVDDEAQARLLARVVLEAEGMAVVEAETADEALERAERHQPDVIVLDHRIGGQLTGVDLAPLLLNCCPRTRVVIYSAVITDDYRWREGVHAMVEKVDSPRLVRVVAGWVPALAPGTGRSAHA